MFGAGWGLGTSPPFHLDFLGPPGNFGQPPAPPTWLSPARQTCPGAHFLKASLGGQGSVDASLVTQALPSLAQLLLPEPVCACSAHPLAHAPPRPPSAHAGLLTWCPSFHTFP